MLLEIGGRLLTAFALGVVAVLVIQWWSYRSGGRR